VTSMPAALRSGFLLVGIAILVAACSSGGGSSSRPEAPATVTDGAVTVTADDLEFDATSIEAQAGEAFTITLVNNDSAPHNISVYTEEGGERLVEGTVINEGETIEIEVPALEAGTYFFVCDVHPDMNGPLVVSGATSS
jgi:plastocyanin